MARQRAALRLAFAATLALVWGTMAGEPLPGLTAVLAAQILVGMPGPPRLGQAVVLVAMVAITGDEPLQKCRKRIRRCQNRGVTLPPGSARGMP